MTIVSPSNYLPLENPKRMTLYPANQPLVNRWITTIVTVTTEMAHKDFEQPWLFQATLNQPLVLSALTRTTPKKNHLTENSTSKPSCHLTRAIPITQKRQIGIHIAGKKIRYQATVRHLHIRGYNVQNSSPKDSFIIFFLLETVPP